MDKNEKTIAELMLREGKIISEENYNDGKKEICFCFVEFGGSVLYITTWDNEPVYVRFDHKI